PDFQGIVNELAIEVDTADAIDPQQLVRDDFLENRVQLVILREPAVTTNIELKLAVFGVALDRPGKTAHEWRGFHNSDRCPSLAQHIGGAEAGGTGAHDNGLPVGVRLCSVGLLAVLHVPSNPS